MLIKPYSAFGLTQVKGYNKFQIGLSVYYNTRSFNGVFQPIIPLSEPGAVGWCGGSNLKGIRFNFNEYEIPINVFLNRKIIFKQFEAYSGFSICYTLDGTNTNVPHGNEAFGLPSNHHWFSAGLRCGATYFIAKNIGINAEVEGDNNFHIQNEASGYYLFSFPVTFGIRYRIL